MTALLPMPPPKPRAIRKRKRTPRSERESYIEETVCKYAGTKGYYVRKFTSPNHRSVPDRMFISPNGTVFFIEFKAKGKTSTEGQIREQKRIRAYGLRAYEVDNIDGGKRIIDVTP